MAGFSQGGGVGLALANWMIEGDPGHDVWGMDVARFGDWATLAYTNAKVRENYSRRFRIRFPNEELPAGAAVPHLADLRPARRRQRRDGRILRAGESAVVRAEGHRADRERHLPPLQRLRACRRRNAARCAPGVGVTEIANYGKIEVEGPKAAEFLAPRDGRTHPGGRPARAVADAQREGQADRRFHHQPLRAGQVPAHLLARGGDYYLRWFERHRRRPA